ncbi:MAG TPA: zinc-dependent alcohol dehydrogenase [Thermoanaerobaculia bacterium]|jgi:threonine dehydrogenase-like Zn-dependent dehydrogenase
MKAACWNGKTNVVIRDVPEPKILNPRDAIVRVTTSAICGSDLHLYGGFVPSMEKGDILGHEFMGEVVAVGPAVSNLFEGDRVVVPFAIACGACYFCERELWSLCDNSNPSAGKLEKLNGSATSGLFGYSHLYGGYAGGQAEFVRVPFADVGPMKVPAALEDEKVLFLSDIFPTGYMAADNCDISPGDTIAVFGAGPVGQFAIRSAFLLGAERVIAIESVPERLAMAEAGGAEPLDENAGDVIERLREMTGGMGPDSCIDAVGMEAHGHGMVDWYDKVKQTVKLEQDRPIVLRTAIMACRPGGTVSIPGVYAGFLDRVPLGAAFAKGLTFRMGQTHVHRYLRRLLEHILDEDIDPSFVITHRIGMEGIPDAYETFRDKKDGCIKVVIKPRGDLA